MKRVLSIAVATLLLSQVSLGQEAPVPPKPGPEHEVLKDMEGTWDAEKKRDRLKIAGELQRKTPPPPPAPIKAPVITPNIQPDLNA